MHKVSMPQPFDILFEDNHCLVVCKPARLLSASDHSEDPNLFRLVKGYLNAKRSDGKEAYLAPIHFLDRPVSGVMIYAKSSKAAARLNRQFKEHRIRKTYIAIVEGNPNPPSGELRDALVKDKDQNRTYAAEPGDSAQAKDSTLNYEVRSRRGDLSLLVVRPKTGRSHQIRVQLSLRNWPIYGDRKYGSGALWSNKIALHAYALTIEHPTLKETMTFKAMPPEDWEALWPKLHSAIGNLS